MNADTPALVQIDPAPAEDPAPDPRFAAPYDGWGKCEVCDQRVPPSGPGRLGFWGLQEVEYPRWCRECLVLAGPDYLDVLAVYDAAVTAEQERLNELRVKRGAAPLPAAPARTMPLIERANEVASRQATGGAGRSPKMPMR